MRIIARSTLVAFWTRHPHSTQALKAWFKVVKHANWKSPNDVKTFYRAADVLKNGGVVFDISGNKYRIVAWINYEYRILYIRFVGTHAEYDKIDATTI